MMQKIEAVPSKVHRLWFVYSESDPLIIIASGQTPEEAEENARIKLGIKENTDVHESVPQEVR